MSALPYGPNTAEVRAFLVRLAGLGTNDRAAVVARHTALAETRAYELADSALGDAIARSGREEARDALTGPLLQIVKRSARDDETANIAQGSESDEGDVELDAIAEPALAALLALLVRDLLNADTLRVLTAPFADVIPT